MVMGSLHPKLVLREAKELEAQGNHKEASRKYASLIPVLLRREKTSEALALCEKVLSLSPESTRILLTKALCLVDLKRNNEALEEVDRFALAALRQNRLTQYLKMANEKLLSHSVMLQRFLEKILEVERTRADVFISLGNVLRRQGKIQRAMEMGFAALKTGLQEDECLQLIKSLLDERGQIDDYQYFEKLINKTWSLEKVRQVLLKESSLEKEEGGSSVSDEQYSSVISAPLKFVDEDNASTLKELIQKLEEQLGDRPQGIDTLSSLISEFKEKALKVVFDDAKAVLDMSVAFKEMGLLTEAREFLSEISVESELFATAQALLGELEFESESFFKALDIFQNLLRKESLEESIQKMALYYLTRIYCELGDFKKAEDFAERLAKMDSQYRNLASLRSGISRNLERNTRR
jgi:tetratricopeptide (TPR) repeat protein